MSQILSIAEEILDDNGIFCKRCVMNDNTMPFELQVYSSALFIREMKDKISELLDGLPVKIFDNPNTETIYIEELEI